MGTNKSHYDELGVSRTATHAEIRRAYRHLMRTLHPDSNDGRVDAVRITKVNEAWNVLSQSSSRIAYDKSQVRTSGPVNDQPQEPQFPTRTPQRQRATSRKRNTEHEEDLHPMNTDCDSWMTEAEASDWKEFLDKADLTIKDQQWARAAVAMMQKRHLWEQRMRKQAHERSEWAVA